jgi:hypothetical protein
MSSIPPVPLFRGTEYYPNYPHQGNTTKVKKTGGTRQPFLIYTRHESSSSCALVAEPLGSFVRPPAKSKY